ncbi:AI-2E family transporter [Aquisalimonas asiatica]|uniref:Predicted PurR-regulated permease PerM n=1 Tax=Aquisalimonas asiatica TaxID=406100 RepID=A0A1H8T130_9GAMM|nr:AI-2E family transporter [Aquisalimonas asiatica]SEO84739.1 Predicted PurR-regulated permease PerM [Aquisalimonas asiatica]
MGSVDDCFDNAMVESYFATLERELLDRRRFRNPTEARLEVFRFIEGWYKPHRRSPCTSPSGGHVPMSLQIRYRAPAPAGALWLIAIILLVAALYWLRPLAAPIAFSLFLIALVWPLYRHNAARGRAQRGLALVGCVLLVLAGALALLALAGYAIRTVADGLGVYGPQLQSSYRAAVLWLEAQGIAAPTGSAQFSPTNMFHVIHQAAAQLNAILAFLALTLIFMIMGLLEVDTLRRRLPYAVGAALAERLVRAFQALAHKLRRYMLVRSVISAITGLLTWLLAVLLGLDLAVAWGTLAFALNFIPFVGSIIAVFPPALFAVAQFDGWLQPLLVLTGMGLIQFSIGNFLDPKLEGRILTLSPFAVIFSVFFWGVIWGIPGAFMGVPLTIALATICGQFRATGWVSRLLSPAESGTRLDEGT